MSEVDRGLASVDPIDGWARGRFSDLVKARVVLDSVRKHGMADLWWWAPRLRTMTNDPTFEAERLIWRFKQSGAEGVFSKPFLSFPEQVQDAVREEAALRDGEVPAILCYLSAAKWALLTNERVVWGVQAQVRSVELTQVADATVESTALLRAGSKQALSSLTLVERTGAQHQIELEPGPPFSGFWNAIKAASEG